MTGSEIRVLVVDDEPAIRRYLSTTLGAEGYHIELARSGQEATLLCASFRPDQIILDLGLPDEDGLSVIGRLRSITSAPIIVLSVREAAETKVRALDAGADDYVTKPFNTGELLARMRVVMRRPSQAAEEPVFSIEELTIDLSRRRVSVSGREVALTPTEYDLLHALATYPGRVVTQRQLIDHLWGDSHDDAAHLLRVNVSNLRRKLEADPVRPHYIMTEAGVGYRLRVAA